MTNLPATMLSDRAARRIGCAAVGVLVLGLVLLFVLLALHADGDDDSSGQSCPGYAAGTVNPATCLPYGQGHGAAAGTGNAGSSARKPAPQQPKAPAAKAPAAPAPKAPAPAVKVPAPPVRMGK
ncbi:hypothetical protein ACFT38_28240 [Streptomyces sp. NPDC056975]|uniref:hypothetical protein n=1 Tax=Streptomyces sp. NPDC056975 TaxID=3345985 RepID=UPI003628615F